MFLEAERIPAIIRNMQDTNLGGYNLIVCAMDTEDYPCQMPSRLPLKKEEWRSITRIGNWSNTMKILATSIVEMRMEIEFNFDLQPCWQRKNKEKAGC